jgi:hypothetical protein
VLNWDFNEALFATENKSGRTRELQGAKAAIVTVEVGDTINDSSSIYW